MNHILALLKNFILKYHLIVIAFVLFTLYFWNRFFKLRTSKMLPFNLSVQYFFILVYICIIFTTIIVFTLFPRKKNELLEKFMDWIFIPFTDLDNFIKGLSKIKPHYNKFMQYMIPHLEYLIVKTNLFVILFWFIPRIILLTALFIDVFYFHQFHYKYVVIYFGIILFLNRYLRFSLKKYKKDLILEAKDFIDTITTTYVPHVHPCELEPDYDPDDPDNDDWPETMYLPFDIFIEFQTNSIVYDDLIRKQKYISIKYEYYEKIAKEQYNKDFLVKLNNIDDEEYQFQKQILRIGRELGENILEKTLQVSLIIEYYNKKNQNKAFNVVKVLIYLNYLICWLYVLMVSIHTLDMEDLVHVFLNTWLLLQDPFTDEYVFQLYEIL